MANSLPSHKSPPAESVRSNTAVFGWEGGREVLSTGMPALRRTTKQETRSLAWRAVSMDLYGWAYRGRVQGKDFNN